MKACARYTRPDGDTSKPCWHCNNTEAAHGLGLKTVEVSDRRYGRTLDAKPHYRWRMFAGMWAWWHVGDYEKLWSSTDFGLSFRYLKPGSGERNVICRAINRALS